MQTKKLSLPGIAAPKRQREVIRLNDLDSLPYPQLPKSSAQKRFCIFIKEKDMPKAKSQYDEPLSRPGQIPAPLLRDNNDILDTDAQLSGDIDARLR